MPGPKAGSKTWSVESARYVWRSPSIKRGRWRVARRDKLSGEVTTLSLDALVTNSKGKGVKAARQEVVELAAEDTAAAEAEVEAAPVEVDMKDATVGQAFDAWFVHDVEVADTTSERYQHDLRKYKRLLGENRLVREIGLVDVQRMFAKEWSDSAGQTKIRHRGALRRIFNWCVAVGACSRSPADKLRIQKTWRDSKKAGEQRGQAMEVGEQTRLLEAATEPYAVCLSPTGEGIETEIKPPEHLYRFLLISLRTGLRAGAARALRWKDFDLKKGTMFLGAEIMKNRVGLKLPVHVELLEELRRWRATDRKIRADDLIVGPIKYLRTAYDSCLVRAGLARPEKPHFFLGKRAKSPPALFRIHDLRYSFGQLLEASRPTEAERLILMQKASHDETNRYFSNHSMDELREQLDKLPRILPKAMSVARTTSARKATG